MADLGMEEPASLQVGASYVELTEKKLSFYQASTL
jgi:hypothetical protein